MTVGQHQGSTRPQVGPCSSTPGQAQGMCRRQCRRKYLASLLDCTHCSDRSPKSSPSGSHRGARCSGSGPGAVALLVAVLKGQKQPLEAASGPCLPHVALLIQVGVPVSPTEVIRNEASFSSVSVTFGSFTMLGWFRTFMLLTSGRSSWRLEKPCQLYFGKVVFSDCVEDFVNLNASLLVSRGGHEVHR